MLDGIIKLHFEGYLLAPQAPLPVGYPGQIDQGFAPNPGNRFQIVFDIGNEVVFLDVFPDRGFRQWNQVVQREVPDTGLLQKRGRFRNGVFVLAG